MGLSMYHSATGNQSPHCIHAIGIGKTGAYMVEALLRTGEIEDLLEDHRARFTGLAIDIGDQDMHELREYANGFNARLDERGIPGSAPKSARWASKFRSAKISRLASTGGASSSRWSTPVTTGILTTSRGCRP